MKANNKNIHWSLSCFDDLDMQTLYDILKLRSEVFVLEQHCIYQDVDGKDQKAIHLQGLCDDRLVAYCRLFKSGDYYSDASIGRVVIAAEYRKFGFGHQLIDKAVELLKEKFGENQITISAQLYLKSFYENHGFIQISDEYLDANIAHIEMKRS